VVGHGGIIRTPHPAKQADLLMGEGVLVVGGKVLGVKNS
jgi:hypothetical protein